MPEKWITELKADPMEWLLGSDNPSVRYFALKDLVDYPDDDSEVVEAKASIRDWEKVTNLFSKQRPEGHWESPDRPYSQKYKASYWQLILLGMLGLDKEDERVQRAVNHIFGFQHEEGGFTELGLKGAREEYARRRVESDRGAAADLKAWTEERVRASQMSCLTGNVVLSLIRLGYCDDNRVGKALDWLVEIQNPDGGWLCPYWEAHLKDTHGCFMGTITPLHALAEYPEARRKSDMLKTIRNGAEFLLMHRLFKADNHGFKVINQSWLELRFPQFFYDMLRGLLVVTKLGYGADTRIDDALMKLLQKQNDEGKWTLDRSLTGRLQTGLDMKGRPSKWVTLDALRVIKRVVQQRGHLGVRTLASQR
jgi:hypothetical protein